MTAIASDPPATRQSLSFAFLAQVILIANSFIMLYPVVVMVLSAFKTTGEIFEHPFALPDFTQVGNFAKVLGETSMPTYFVNSILVTGASVILILVLGTMAGYAVARYESRTNTIILLFFLAGLMLPLKLAVIPLFILLRDLGLLDSRWSLIVTYTAIGLPSAVFIMAGFLRTLPSELEDAARIDGASEPRIMWSVMLPLARPPMAIAAIQNAVPIWNDFFFPLVFIQTDARKTLPQGLTTFMGEYTTDWGMLFAGLTIAAAPITLLYIALSRQFIQGMTAGAVK
ncbi:carbohydrate ABC transporter permease [Microvirga arsenatis]|uniref:ABC transporter permease subunit n=1 Tax=Microvirga arsenatis TaxID=2692265 RepID=A0ABW9YV37_9HYPH|nr:carbohydrate ABC transporter permease [Microvirga arsenatis]NBJ11873.1 ABC transporter permease subunit [Microvirga arsenatis]NBJ23985.1 ABC transporter permease subunit [Microvirga arsenatis]